jgi:hypothetical protein
LCNGCGAASRLNVPACLDDSILEDHRGGWSLCPRDHLGAALRYWGQFIDLGADHDATRPNPERRVRHHIRELQALGYTVTLNPAA